MRIASVFAFFICPILPAFAQANLQYMQPLFDSMRDSARIAQQMREMNETRRHNMAEEALQKDEMRARYRELHANEADWRINQDTANAFNGCRALHDDCDKLGWIMKIVANSLPPDWSRISMADYVECLYAIAKSAAFAEQARQIALKPPVPNATK